MYVEVQCLYAGVHNTCTTYNKWKEKKKKTVHILMNKLITLIRLVMFKFMEPELQYDLFSTQKK